MKVFLALGVRKSVLEELAFATFNFLTFPKFDFLDLVNFDFLNLADFVMVNKYLISLLASLSSSTLFISLGIF